MKSGKPRSSMNGCMSACKAYCGGRLIASISLFPANAFPHLVGVVLHVSFFALHH